MRAADVLLKPEECAMLLVDFQAGLGFGVESASRQVVLNKCRSMARTFLAFQLDWTRQETYEAARAVVVANGGGYGIGLAYAREMIHPGCARK
jgi:hypothetical protein